MSAPGSVPGFVIRIATAADCGAVAALTEAAYAPYAARFGAPPIPVTEDYAPRIERGEVWLLTGEGPPAGLLVLEQHADHLLIFSIAVAPQHQHKGFGQRLLAWAERAARAAGVGELRLYTNARMERNIALYTACGYRETGRRANPLRSGWTVVDMAKPLDATAPGPA